MKPAYDPVTGQNTRDPRKYLADGERRPSHRAIIWGFRIASARHPMLCLWRYWKTRRLLKEGAEIQPEHNGEFAFWPGGGSSDIWTNDGRKFRKQVGRNRK
jgi:hypothetical protein